MYAIETINLTKQFGNIKGVDNLCLKVPEGSVYGFLGLNGAGKTTTFKMLTGLINSTSGEIKFLGNPVDFKDYRTKFNFGYLPDVPGFYDWMNAAEFLKFSGELVSIPNDVLKNRIEMLLDMVGLEDPNKKISKYSRGMKQRLGIAQALIHNPKMLFLDEPVSALDPIGRKDVMDIIEKLSGKVTVLFSSHILSDVERVCDQVAIINKGKIRLEGPISDIRKTYGLKALEIELGSGSINELQEVLQKLEWVKNSSVSESKVLKINTNNIEEAQKWIPTIIAEKGLALKKFIVSEGTLEDAFLKVVSENE